MMLLFLYSNKIYNKIDKDRITLSDVLECATGDIMVQILFDTEALESYDRRENTNQNDEAQDMLFDED